MALTDRVIAITTSPTSRRLLRCIVGCAVALIAAQRKTCPSGRHSA